MKGFIKGLLREGLFGEDITSGSSQLIYHRTNKSSFKQIINNSIRLGTKGFYGLGFYGVTDLASALTSYSKKHYGNYVIECSINSLDGFLILNEEIARKTYGSKYINIDSQLKHILGNDFPYYDKLNEIIEANNGFKFTSELALQLAKFKPLIQSINGMVYENKNDGNCIVCYNNKLSEIELLRVTNNNGKSWVKI